MLAQGGTWIRLQTVRRRKKIQRLCFLNEAVFGAIVWKHGAEGGILILISQPELGPQERSPERPCLDLQKEDGGQKDQAPGARS